MQIVSVLPLTKTFGKGASCESLSYFSATQYEPGTLVKVPLRGRDVRALVIESKPAEVSRMDLRKGAFSLKKIKSNSGKIFVSEAFMLAVKKFADYEAQSYAATLSTLLPSILFETKRSATPNEPKCTLMPDVNAFQGNTEERFAQYRSLIRETFARKKSFFLLVPTAEDAKWAHEELSRGIDMFTAVFFGSKGKKEIERELKKVDDQNHPVLIIATPPFLCLLRTDTETIVLDRENSRAYRTLQRPNLDFKIFAKILAHEYCTRLIMGSDILSVDVVQGVRDGEINEWGHMKMRELVGSEVSVVSMVKKDLSEPFNIFSPILKKELESITETRKRFFLFGTRKGLSPITVCADCEEIVSCKVCGAPLVLYGNKDSNKPFFLCHKCGERIKAEDKCNNCGGWRLVPLGIGIENIEREVQKISPTAKIFKIDKESTKTGVKALKIVEEFNRIPGSVLIGTEMALYYLHQPVDIAAVVSADSLLGIPDFRVNEKLISLLIRIRALGKEKVIFQTRSKPIGFNEQTERSVFDFAAEGNFLAFFEKEINERKKFAFPPFSLFIKIVWEGSPARAEKDSEQIKNLFGDDIEIFRARGGSRQVRYHGLIKIERRKIGENGWPKMPLVDKLLSLPPQFSIFVDPDALL